MVITWGALFVSVVLVKSKLRISACGSIVTCMILTFVKSLTGDARFISVSMSDVCVKCVLSLLGEVFEGFYC